MVVSLTSKANVNGKGEIGNQLLKGGFEGNFSHGMTSALHAALLRSAITENTNGEEYSSPLTNRLPTIISGSFPFDIVANPWEYLL
ncbi:MAG: hypothetical protein RLZZ367_2285, partial [Bacteroidota bacterium]